MKVHLPQLPRRPRDSERGTAIVPALLVVVIVSTLSMIYLQLSLAKNREQRTAVDTKRAFYMAEAGLSEAFNGLCLGKSGFVGSEDTPARFANGIFYVTAKDEGQGRTTLESTGLCGAGRATLSIVVERTPQSTSSLGVFSTVGTIVEAGSLIDSYDSRLGSYASQAPPAGVLPLGAPLPVGARVGSNADVDVRGGGLGNRIYGDARPGPTGTLLRGRNVTITGSTAPNTGVVQLPAVEVPCVPSLGDVRRTKHGQPLRITQSEVAFDDLALTGGARVSFIGPTTIIVRTLSVVGSAQLEFDATAGPVNLYVRDGMKLTPGTTFSARCPNPGSVSVQIAASQPSDLDGDGSVDPPVTFAGTGEFVGTIYAPGASITIPPTLTVYGGVAAQQVLVQSGGAIHFDRALTEGSSEGSTAPHYAGWRVVELPSVPMVFLRFDVLTALKRLGVEPPQAKDAHYNAGVAPPAASRNMRDDIRKILKGQ